MKDGPIDIVVTWLDANDPKWLADKTKWQEVMAPDKSAVEARRFDNDQDLLRYWFRLVEKNAPFVRKIFFVTYGHVPDWLDTKNEKVVVVKHSDFIPREYLPTFNSSVIEMNLFRIEGLSERFIYLNDDVYLSAPVCAGDFFVGDKARFNYSETLMVFDESLDMVFRSILLNVARVINRNFNKRSVIMKHPGTFFSLKNLSGARSALRWLVFNKYLGPIPAHISMPFFKSTMKKIWRAEPDMLDAASRLRFRDAATVSPYVVEVWQAFSGKTIAYRQKKFGKLISEDKVSRESLNIISEARYKVVCLNGQYDDASLKSVKNAFLKLVPGKSAFEK